MLKRTISSCGFGGTAGRRLTATEGNNVVWSLDCCWFVVFEGVVKICWGAASFSFSSFFSPMGWVIDRKRVEDVEEEALPDICNGKVDEFYYNEKKLKGVK